MAFNLVELGPPRFFDSLDSPVGRNGEANGRADRLALCRGVVHDGASH